MKKEIRSLDQLLAAWKTKEEEKRIMEEREREEAKKDLPRQCKNCFHSWYKVIEPTGCFTEASEYCGCRLKNDLVDPYGICDSFKL